MAHIVQLFACISLLLLPILTNSENPTPPFEFLKHLQGCKKGEKLLGIHQLKQYLNKFGYLDHYTWQSHDDNDFDDYLEAAIRTYQKHYNLKITGTLDSETLSKMVMPRCGVPDVLINGTSGMTTKMTKKHHHHHHHSHPKTLHTVSHYTFFQGYPRWPAGKTHLTYAFNLGTTHPDAIPPFVRAFDKWAYYTQYFTFSEISEYLNADLKIGFGRGDHGDGYPFDGPGGVLAHAFAPINGRLHFDADEFWSIGAITNYNDIETVALHEIGHLLGLDHSSVEDAIMYPTIPPGLVKELHTDDVQGIRALYNV